MARLTIEVDGLDAATRRIGRLAAAGRDTTPLMRDIGEYLIRSTKDRFAAQLDPEGKPWKPLSRSYREQKKRNKHRILTLDGHLGGTINYRAGRTEVLVGSPRVYAAVHQFGAAKGAFGATVRGAPIPWGNIPARPFLGLSAADRDEIALLVRDYLAKTL